MLFSGQQGHSSHSALSLRLGGLAHNRGQVHNGVSLLKFNLRTHSKARWDLDSSFQGLRVLKAKCMLGE